MLGLLSVLLVGCFHESAPPPTVDALHITRELPAQAVVGEPFTVRLTVTVDQALPAVSIREDVDGLTIVDKGDFPAVEGNTLRGFMIQPPAGASQTFLYEVKCSDPITYAITAIVQSKDVTPAWETSSIKCVER